MNSIYFQYLNDIAKYPLLTREQEKVLIPLAHQGNRRAIDLLVKSNLKFVVNIANLYKGQGLDIGELINEGNMGLIEAARRFDPNQKIKFISYAVWWIRQNIIRAISEKARLVRISAEKELVLRRFNRLSTKTRQVVGGQMVIDPESLEGASRYNAKEIEKILQMGARSSSLDSPVGEDGDSTLGECLPADTEATDALAAKNGEQASLNNLLKENLTEQEHRVLGLYYGLDMDADLNLKEIGKMVGLSKERVRQVKERALAKLRSTKIDQVLDAA
ncbi:MAG: RNA polymerase sigma factor RpoD/SigA [Hallerella porci]|uniref:RNA polymerase primary sigma factor n=1 Tax=Hallerella porci TaxID=1945871 RepID=A0ABX5LL23_9BACT|nr:MULTISPECIES: RNA polymerase sigma factor RpoD/SigA [Hallerella]MCI5601840.1 RNA polymerase sigma factor RpoD/SigA [Hallerella sp.]MDY3921845.1 RNA polymerase sigma factor RpoD/SigA [Hallerella porci]PWK95589.1 RNA polymerase primary sigma factor [Hallerella porci]